MELKRILARDSRAANEKAIQLYGPDVLVISSQRVDSQTELIVAVDTDGAPAATPGQVAGSPAPAAHVSSDADKAQARFQAFSDVFKVSVEQPDAPELPEPVTTPASTPAPAPVPALGASGAGQADVLDAGDWEPAALRLSAPAPQPAAMQASVAAAPASATLGTAGAVAEEALQQVAELRRSHDTVELLRQEIAALRQEFHLNRQVAMWQSGQGLSPELTQWFAHMQELGVPASLRTLMVDATTDCSTVAQAWPRVHQTLLTAIERRKCAWPQQGVHALIGPSGAGKSLMVARMALATTAQVGVDDMAIISLADTRPGAWSQLQVLAAQSGVTCYRATDAAALDVLLQELSHLRLVWIDTPGTDFMAQARALQSAQAAVSLHAVLPLDATVTNVRKVFESQEASWASVMLTKLDEAAHPWPVLKALCDRPLAVSAVGASHQARIAPQAFEARALVDIGLEGLRPQGLVSPSVLAAPVVSAPPAPRKPARRRAAAPATSTAATAVTTPQPIALSEDAGECVAPADVAMVAAVTRKARAPKAKVAHG